MWTGCVGERLRLNTSSGVIEIVTVRGRANINLAVAGGWREKCGFEKHLGIRVGRTFDLKWR